jgi:hypothetical protein
MSNLSPAPFSPASWTDADHRECIRLMQKAHGCGVLKAMVSLVMDQDPDWSVVSGQSSEGAMNDASKRLRETSADKPMKTYAASSEIGTMAVPMPSAGYGVKVPKLPPGVDSVEAWGRTKISFGKFKDKRTYSGLHVSQSAEDRSYKSWLAPRHEKGSPQLQDLVNYLVAMGDPSVIDLVHDKQVVTIPGTDIPRRMG